MTHCRLCGDQLGPVLLSLEGMPASAQNLPSAAELLADVSQTLEIRQCVGCGLAQVSCEPVPYYREVIRATAFSEEMRRFRQVQLSKFTARFSLHSKRVLEVGSGCGEYLELLDGAGMEAWGTEAGSSSVEKATRAGCRVQKVFPEEAETVLEGGPFSAFFSFNFMEHWPRPRGVLACIRRHLTQDAVGLVEVPNFDMLIEKRMATEFIADHLSYFTANTFRTALELSGFEVVEIEEVWHRYILSATVRKRRLLVSGPFLAGLHTQRERIAQFASGSGERGLAVWGAGHQALASMALMGLKGRVRYVVDSASFKQGKFTPATHFPIVSPDELDRNPVSSILVMAAGFSDEVVRIIRRRWGQRFQVAILREDSFEEL